MDALLNFGLPSAHFYRDTCTLKEFLANCLNSNRYKLPAIVNITSLNNYGRCMKNTLTKNTVLLLIAIDQLDSVVAEYYGTHDGRAQAHRHRLTLPQNKILIKTSTKLRNMKKLSKSVASLTPNNNHKRNSNVDDDDDDYPDGDDENAYNIRTFMKLLKEKRSPSVSMCRIPTQYRSFFELLNANDQPIEPCHKLRDLLIIEYDENDPDKRTDISPSAIFLHSFCRAYTKKPSAGKSHVTKNEHNSALTVSVDSCYGSSSELDLHKNLVTFNDTPEILQAGQTLTISGDCYALRAQPLDKETKQYQSAVSLPGQSSPTSWWKIKSKFLLKKHRHSNPADNLSDEITRRTSNFETLEHFVECQTEQDDVIYISLNEPGLFSPLNRQTSSSILQTPLNYIHTSDVFQVKDILSNFRFPISVRLLDGPISFDNIYAPAMINRQDTSRLSPTKFRLLGSHNERVVFACPLNKTLSKHSKSSSSSSYNVLPLSINADIEIQVCSNTDEILRTENINKIMDGCFRIIKQHQNEIGLIHFPLFFSTNRNPQRETLYKKRSQSESFAERFQDHKSKLRHSTEQLNDNRRYSDERSVSSISSPREATRRKSSASKIRPKQSTNRNPSHHTKIQNDAKKQNSWISNQATEDEIYEDLDKIYDYIRTGDITDDVQKIQAREQHFDTTDTCHTPNQLRKTSDPQFLPMCPSPGTMVTHRFPLKCNDRNPPFSPCKTDGNVDNDQARALYLASKEPPRNDSQDSSNSKTIIKMKRINKQ